MGLLYWGHWLNHSITNKLNVDIFSLIFILFRSFFYRVKIREPISEFIDDAVIWWLWENKNEKWEKTFGQVNKSVLRSLFDAGGGGRLKWEIACIRPTFSFDKYRLLQSKWLKGELKFQNDQAAKTVNNILLYLYWHQTGTCKLIR